MRLPEKLVSELSGSELQVPRPEVAVVVEKKGT